MGGRVSIQADERGDEVLRLRETRNILKSFGNSLDALLNPFFRDDEFGCVFFLFRSVGILIFFEI